MITHMILLQMENEDQAAEAVTRLRGMAGRIPGMRDLRAGRNLADSPFHLGLVTTHEDADALETYRTHPAHVEVLEWLRPRIAQRAVVDFDAGE